MFSSPGIRSHPFTWGRRRRELAEKSKAAAQARNALSEAESAVLVEVGSRFRALEEARELLRVVQAGQDSAREDLRVLQNRYAEKAALLKDLLSAKASLAEASAQYQQALAAFWSAKAEFGKSMGED